MTHRIIEDVPVEFTHVNGVTYDGLLDRFDDLSDEQFEAMKAKPGVHIIVVDRPEIGPDPVGYPRQKEVKTPRLDENDDPVLDKDGNPVVDTTYEDVLIDGEPVMDGIGDPIELYPDTILYDDKSKKVKKRHTWNGWRPLGEDLPAPVAVKL